MCIKLQEHFRHQDKDADHSNKVYRFSIPKHYGIENLISLKNVFLDSTIFVIFIQLLNLFRFSLRVYLLYKNSVNMYTYKTIQINVEIFSGSAD